MNITGAELINRFLESRSTGGGSADADVHFLDLRKGFAEASRVLDLAKQQQQAAVYIATQVRRYLIGTDACQPERVRALLGPLTQAWFHIGTAVELLELLPEAFRLADDSPRGPVLLEIPEDVLAEVIEGAWIPQACPHRCNTVSTSPSMSHA
jgi:acetolactate synthase-1/2/3 large subunit